MSNLAKTPLRQVTEVKQLLMNDQARSQLSMVAAKHMNPERLMRVTANAIRTTPKLQECDPLSFLGALMQCSALGLEPNTVMGHAYLVPFDNRRKNITEVQLIVGYRGLIDLARRSGHITRISANIHYSDDELWEYEEGTEARLRHRPGPQLGEKLHAYAIAKFKDGSDAYVVLPWAKVMKIRDGSQGYRTAKKYNNTNTPWIEHEDAMAQKTAIRALAKFLPLSVEFSEAIQFDADNGTKVDYASFAMNPEDGVTIEGDVDDLTDETDQKADPEPEKEQPKQRAKPAQKAAAKEPEPEKEQAQADKGADDVQAEPEKTDPKWEALATKIEDDLTDGATPESVRKFYEDALAEAEKAAPEDFKQINDMISAYEEKE